MPKKQEVYRQNRIAEGKCRVCSAPTEVIKSGARAGKHRAMCPKHLEIDNARNEAKRKKLVGKCKYRVNGKLCLKKTKKARWGFNRFCSKHSS